MHDAHGLDGPILYQVLARDWFKLCASQPGRLDQLPDAELDRIAGLGFNCLYLLGVWQTGAAGRAESQHNPAWRRSFVEALPDLREEDIVGSPFAVAAYAVHQDFGGNGALAALRSRLRKRGISLLLDFVPNHTAQDHPWVLAHPEYFVQGSAADLAREPQNYLQPNKAGPIFAYGRDPYFSGWPDTLQLNFGNAAMQGALIETLEGVAAQCDGVRCDMAMLMLPDVFQRTWGIPIEPFWDRAIPAARRANPSFLFVAEVYWGRDGELQQLGFDYTYDKTLYDRLVREDAEAVRGHLLADLECQRRSVRFLENHDEPRAAAIFPVEQHKAAANIAFLVPGMRFFHEGQLEGYIRKPSIHLGRRFEEKPNPEVRRFYLGLLELLKSGFAGGGWTPLETRQAWEGNETWNDFVCFAWSEPDGAKAIVVVNYSPHRSQCYVRIPSALLQPGSITLHDEADGTDYQRDGGTLLAQGLYADRPAWGYHLLRFGSKKQS